jgi:hypothetical protein
MSFYTATYLPRTPWAQSVEPDVPLSEMSISSTRVRRTAALHAKLVKHCHIEAIGAETHDHARVHRRASERIIAKI